jgi:ribulose-phosphate 3-epimerase
MAYLSASLLAADFAHLAGDVQRAEQAGVDAFHFDMMDGHYVPNIALAPQHLAALRPYTQLPFDLHLELENTDQVLSTFQELAADLILVQWDTLTDPLHTFSLIRSRGGRVGLSLNPDIQLGQIQPFLSQLDILLLLSVNPGFGGQLMVSGTPERVFEAYQMAQAAKPSLPIAVDGGVSLNNAARLVQAGASWLIVGTALFQASDLAGFVRDIHSLT